MMPFSPASAPDFLTLTYRPDLHLLVSRWQRPVSGAEFRQGYRATLALARAVGCPYWQIDWRGCTAPEPALQQWLTTQFLPCLPSKLAAPVYVGFLLTPQVQRAAPAAVAAEPAAVAAPKVAFFAEEGPLLNWLTQGQHRAQAAVAAPRA